MSLKLLTHGETVHGILYKMDEVQDKSAVSKFVANNNLSTKAKRWVGETNQEFADRVGPFGPDDFGGSDAY